MTAEEINLAAETADKTPDPHVIGWVILFMDLTPDGSATFSLGGAGFPGSHSLWADKASAEQEAAAQRPSPADVTWLVLPVVDQGNDG